MIADMRCSCGATYDETSWQTLPLVGFGFYQIKEGLEALHENRNCACTSTLSRVLAVSYAENWPVEHRMMFEALRAAAGRIRDVRLSELAGIRRAHEVVSEMSAETEGGEMLLHAAVTAIAALQPGGKIGPRPRWRYAAGGALLADEPFEGLTEELTGETAKDYGARFMIAESMSREAAMAIASAFGADLVFDGRTRREREQGQ